MINNHLQVFTKSNYLCSALRFHTSFANYRALYVKLSGVITLPDRPLSHKRPWS